MLLFDRTFPGSDFLPGSGTPLELRLQVVLAEAIRVVLVCRLPCGALTGATRGIGIALLVGLSLEVGLERVVETSTFLGSVIFPTGLSFTVDLTSAEAPSPVSCNVFVFMLPVGHLTLLDTLALGRAELAPMGAWVPALLSAGKDGTFFSNVGSYFRTRVPEAKPTRGGEQVVLGFDV